MTLIHADRAPGEVFQIAAEEFSDAELANLTVAIANINAWNRVASGLRLTAA